jgi:hypothetical protein
MKEIQKKLLKFTQIIKDYLVIYKNSLILVLIYYFNMTYLFLNLLKSLSGHYLMIFIIFIREKLKEKVQ